MRFKVCLTILALAVTMLAQTAAPAPQADSKAACTADCCKDGAECCKGGDCKDGRMCARKDAKAGCCGDMAKAKACKDGKCPMMSKMSKSDKAAHAGCAGCCGGDHAAHAEHGGHAGM